MKAKRFVILAVCAFLLSSGVIGYFSYRADQDLQKTIMDQFNSQQMILARNIANDIISHFNFLETMLRRINLLWEEGGNSESDIRGDIISLFRLLKDWHVLGIAHIDKVGKLSLLFSDQGFDGAQRPGINSEEYRQWSAQPENRDQVIIGRNILADMDPFRGKLVTVMATPSWRLTDKEKKEAPRHYEGATLLIIDPIALAMQYIRGIRSGKTGYAWVIDHKGTFLAHNEQTFIGEDSFTSRQKKNRQISYDRINGIVREHLRSGQEVMDWYISGWHRGETGEIKKLIALSPVFLSKDTSVNLWSVGVAAPVAEVYGIVESIVKNQWWLAGSFQLVVFFCLILSVYLSLRWSQVLRDKVYEKTADLRKSRTALRRERDKVKRNLQRLMEMQEKLIRSERFAALGEAAAYISHEIKNPLIIMSAYAGQIEKSISDEALSRKLKIIQEEARRLEEMLTAIRDFTRLSRPQKESLSINATIEDTLALMENNFKEKGIVVEKYLGQSMPPLLYDPQQIKQVLINLLNNAAESMPESERLIITSWHERAYIKISIQDSGIGMSDDVAEKIFNPFFTTKTRGSGLGLAVSRKIMEDHGGDISIESEEGKGTKVTLALPVDIR